MPKSIFAGTFCIQKEGPEMRRTGAPRLFLAFVIAIYGSLAVYADSPSLLGHGTWKLLKLDGKVPARFAMNKNRELQVDANAAVAFFYRELARDAGQNKTVLWRWRVDDQIPPTDQGRKGSDDRAIALHLWFDDDTGGALFGALGSLLGRPRIGHLVSYVWGGIRAPGAMMANPYYDKGAIFVVRTARTGVTGKWYDEARNVAQDYKRAFGHVPDLSKLRYIAISADTDDTGAVSSARVADVVLVDER